MSKEIVPHVEVVKLKRIEEKPPNLPPQQSAPRAPRPYQHLSDVDLERYIDKLARNAPRRRATKQLPPEWSAAVAEQRARAEAAENHKLARLKVKAEAVAIEEEMSWGQLRQMVLDIKLGRIPFEGEG